MRIALLTVLTFLGGLIAGYLAAVVVGLLYLQYAGLFDREGAISMGIIFMIGPFAGIVAGLLAAIATATRPRRRATAPTTRTTPDTGR
jgi:hypothetical protein